MRWYPRYMFLGGDGDADEENRPVYTLSEGEGGMN